MLFPEQLFKIWVLRDHSKTSIPVLLVHVYTQQWVVMVFQAIQKEKNINLSRLIEITLLYVV